MDFMGTHVVRVILGMSGCNFSRGLGYESRPWLYFGAGVQGSDGMISRPRLEDELA